MFGRRAASPALGIELDYASASCPSGVVMVDVYDPQKRTNAGHVTLDLSSGRAQDLAVRLWPAVRRVAQLPFPVSG
ncbi:hypothetical protein CTheo_6777 [Ceratobasidium theobromae]|uniref:Uncharacterized protein n=1 Tax=Ceratobasidium theobromae TaxID=1582974 RepID=A0A5N5QDD1_9AGAM|nr:hypothetical protein CTheo_6777 [Ceratobasidium theobromae]